MRHDDLLRAFDSCDDIRDLDRKMNEELGERETLTLSRKESQVLYRPTDSQVPLAQAVIRSLRK